MNPSPPDAGRQLLEVRGARASTVIVRHMSPDEGEAFLDWQRGITRVMAEFPGYQTTEIYPPARSHEQEWVVVIHFDTAQHLQSWLDSPQRAGWLAKLPGKGCDYRLTTLPTGFGTWFAGLTDGPLPHWKSALSVLFGLYPTVMVLTLLLSPHTQRFGLAVALLIGNVGSVSFLEWVGTPLLRPLLGPWLRANGKEDKARSLIGSVLILVALGAMTFLFYLVQP
jgi:uncharacterized protein